MGASSGTTWRRSSLGRGGSKAKTLGPKQLSLLCEQQGTASRQGCRRTVSKGECAKRCGQGEQRQVGMGLLIFREEGRPLRGLGRRLMRSDPF